MKTKHESWSIDRLSRSINEIEFPEFQREPTVWQLEKKQRLIDSILRDFHISSIYFHRKKAGGYDCIDGRQRINAIWSYLGINDADEDHNAFNLKMVNEIYDDGGIYKGVQDKRYGGLPAPWKKKINDYELDIVIITDIEADREEELNLLFLRLQIASILNAGEKLHAMTGEMRDWIFLKIKNHDFYKNINLPTRRYAKEQVASQIALNVFGWKKDNEFKRSRFTDMQEFYKRHSKLGSDEKAIVKGIERNLDIIVKRFSKNLNYIRNRAIAVSTYLFASYLIEQGSESEIGEFVDFFKKFLKTLKWQIPRGVEIDRAYHDLLRFQSNITQAAGEKSAIEKRHDFLKEYFHFFQQEEGLIKGDDIYKKDTRKDPNVGRNKIKL